MCCVNLLNVYSLLLLCFIVAICLGTLRMSHHAIKQKVLQCDEELSDQALSQLLKYLPGPEEVCVRVLNGGVVHTVFCCV